MKSTPVRISYTVEEKEIYSQLAALIGLTAGNLQKVLDDFNAAQAALDELTSVPYAKDDPATQEALEIIDRMRQNLYLVDLRLDEVSSMMTGYATAKETPPPTTREGSEGPGSSE
tara:strand:- start:1501 stop:1845 length:345 start_codon:yes stop_codon:yes gene_type:complete